MNWIQLHFQTTQPYTDTVEGLLYLHGVMSIEITDAADQPILEPKLGTTPLWDDVVVIGLFSAEQLCPQMIDNIQASIANAAMLGNMWISRFEDQVWEHAWMDHYATIQCSEKLWVVPKWLDAPDPSAINIVMDPGMAFGTGCHASTQLCLQWLAEQDLTDTLVLDYGCGSGILAVAALKLGARYAYCVDIDPQAITATLENATLNEVSARLWAGLPDAFSTQNISTADIMIANILAKPLMSLAGDFASLCAHDAKVVLAGIIDGQEQMVRDAYTSYFALPHSRLADTHWISLSGYKVNT